VGRMLASLPAALLLGGGSLALAAAVSVPPIADAYAAGKVRAKITRGLAAVETLEREIVENWSVARVVPRQTDHPGVRARAGAEVIDEITVNPRNGRLRVVLSAAVPEVAGKAIVLAPAVDAADRVVWVCVPIDIPNRYLPETCRHA